MAPTKLGKLGIKPGQSLEVKKHRIIKGVRDVKAGEHKTEVKYGAGSLYRPEVKLDLERAWFYTESYAQTDREPEVIRRAKAFAYYLENETLFVIDNQLLVGNPCDDPRAIGWPHEKYSSMPKRIVNQDVGKNLIEDKNRPKLDEICKRLAGKTLWDREKAARPSSLQKYWKFNGTFYYSQWNEGGIPNFEKVLRVGLNGIIKQAEDKLKEIEDTIPMGAGNILNYQEQREFLEATIIAMKGVIKWAGRYAKYCRELAKKEKDEIRKKQLLQMAEHCDWVPANPPRTFWEALQSFWFIDCARSLKEDECGGCVGRFDKIFRPFYEKDKAEGRITYEEAVELTCMLWLKIQELGWLISPLISGTYAGTGMILTATIGGIDEKGRDITNDLTYIAMDASMKIHGVEPSLCLRVHDGTPRSVILKAVDCLKAGLAYPAFYSDKAYIPIFLRYGWPVKDANDWAILSCVFPVIPGKNFNRSNPGWHSFAMDLWWALHKGINPATGEQFGAPTKDPLEWTCYEDALEAYLEQLRFFFDKQVKLHESTKPLYAKWAPKPFDSALTDGCIEMGKDRLKWEYPYKGHPFVLVVGPINVANSLAAMKKWVFEEKKVTMRELLDAMDANWEGYEELRQLMLSVPKFGNDDDYVDTIAAEVQEKLTQVIEEFTSIYGNHYVPNGGNASAIYAMSLDCGALPEGRRGGEMLADGTVSPMLYTDTEGPTAVLRSVSKINVVNTYIHLLNQRFMPSLLEGEGKEKFADYIKTWMDMGGNHIQFNIVSADMLREAQKYPEKHTELIVRVAGYSAYFVDLSKGLQDGIIERTEHATIG